ncbi:MAG TPA: hypothetical protein PLV73_00875 [Treponemataceae bacterium]|jgi:hypothetical protein|nr:hypothetical protein [Treponema sp.]OQB05119.1 MAG: hypothetical protein BWY20_00002 [Spirochaetes bacterium ADurb.Bin215]HOF86077.1 hypothetical protein [Treponemataceae bacterium]HOS34876.1 hypothetical protein [Treponemataceae bacterium]HPA09353.1 hypothetical protein [Treponemataceae bacterium]
MKNKQSLFLFSLCPLIPATSRFAYALVFSAAILFYYGAGLLVRELVKRLNIGHFAQVLELAGLAGTAALFYGILAGVYPLLALSLEMYIYLSAFSYLLLVSINAENRRVDSFSPVILFIPVLILFSAVRELLGLGTISLPAFSGLLEITVIPSGNSWILRVLGTGGGALILTGIFSFLLKLMFAEKGAHKQS